MSCRPLRALASIAAAGAFAACSTTAPTSPAAAPPHAAAADLITPGQLREVERLVDALAGSEAQFTRRLTKEDGFGEAGSAHEAYRELAEVRSELRQYHAVSYFAGNEQKYYRWEPARHRLIPAPQTHATLVQIRDAGAATSIEIGGLTTGIFAFNLAESGRRISYGGRVLIDPPETTP